MSSILTHSFTIIAKVVILTIVLSSIGAGLECYQCSLGVLKGGIFIKYHQFNFSAGEPPKQIEGCKNPHEPGRHPPETKTCSATEPTCSKYTMLLNHTFLFGTEWYSKVYSFIARKCTAEPLPPKGKRCSPYSEAVERLNPDPNQPSNVTFTGVRCLCGTDKCNHQPGYSGNEEDYVYVKPTTTPTTAVTPIITRTTSTSDSDNLRNTLLQTWVSSSVWLVWCFHVSLRLAKY